MVATSFLYLAADKLPHIDGKSLILDFELKIPAAIQVPLEPNQNNLHASLYANDRDNHYATLDYKSIAKQDDFVIVPARHCSYPRCLIATY